MRHHRALSLLVLAAPLVPAAPVAAQVPAWGPPADGGVVVAGLKEPALDIGGAGDGIYGASLSADPTRPAVPRQGTLGRLSSAGVPGVQEPLDDDLAAGPIAYGRSRVVLLRTALVAVTADLFAPRVRLAVSFGTTTSGDVGAPQTLAADVKLAARPALAANDRGDVVAAWIEDRGANDRLWVARKPAGRPFGRPSVVLGRGDMTALAVAQGTRDDLVVAATRALGGARSVVARHRRPGGSYGATQSLGVDEGLTQIAARLARSGRAVVAWGTQDAGIEATEPFRVRAAVKPAGGSGRFRAAQELQGGAATNERTPGPIALELDDAGAATVAWSTPQGGGGGPLSFPVRVATTDVGAVFGPAQQVATSGVVGGLAVRPGGAAILTYARRDGLDSDAVMAAIRPSAGAPFLAPETVAVQAVDEPPRVAIDPRGRPVTLWTGIVGPQQRVLRLSARGAPIP